MSPFANGILSSYLYKWNLKISTTKTVGSLPSLQRRRRRRTTKKEARREPNVFVNKQTLPPRAEPTYLDIKLDRALTFRRHLESLRKKLTSRVGFKGD